MQQEIFPYINPFKTRFSSWINDSVPALPGMYRFYSMSGELLYVGKSKALKKRLKSYGNLHPGKDSKRLVRLVHQVRKIEFEQTTTEKDALLLENEWLRTKKPPFNRANTKPELYIYVGITKKEFGFEIGWTLSEEHHSFEQLYGAFRGMASTFAMLSSLRRLNELKNEKSILQKKWFGKRPPIKFEISALTFEWFNEMISGERLDCEVFAKFSEQKRGFTQHVVLQDISSLMRWFVFQGLTNRAIKQKFKVKSDLLRNEHLDDWLVKLKG
ncbi:nucleotide excision repair endonuclease [bacterium]|nr:MAG: nucleotide excision repair endonuclease [bacterium]